MGSIAGLDLNLFIATSCWDIELHFLFFGINICVPSTSVFPLNPLSVIAILSLVPIICFLTRSLSTNDSSKFLLLSFGLPENLFTEEINPVCRPLTTHTFVTNHIV